MDNQGQHETETPDTTAQEITEAPADLKEVTKVAAWLKEEIDEMKVLLKTKQEKYQEVCETILKTLELMELENVRAHGFLFYKKVKSSISTPKTNEAKKLLFDWLEDKGIFMEFASVNSQTLQKLYKDQAEEAAKQGNFDFKLPGVDEPVPYTTLELRRSK